MAWERRGGNLYYYQAEREDGRVRKRYIGAGEVAEMIAHADEVGEDYVAAGSTTSRPEVAHQRAASSRFQRPQLSDCLRASARLIASG